VPLIAAVLLLGSCRDAVGPDPGTEALSIQLSVGEPFSRGSITPEGPQISCEVEVGAVITGSAGANAPWSGATFRFAYGADRSHFVDSVRVGASEVRSAWGTNGPVAGETLQSRWTAVSGLPFTLQMEFRYLPSIAGTPVVNLVEFDCGDRPKALESFPPAIVEMAMVPEIGSSVEHGQNLEFRYSASGEAGLWVTGVEIGAPVNQTVYALAGSQIEASATRDVYLLWGTELSDSIQVHIFAVDLMGRRAERRLPDLSLVDRTPPTISALFTGGRDLREGVELTTTDTLRVRIAGHDRYRIDAFVFSLEGAATVLDSIRPELKRSMGYSFEGDVVLPLREEWTGTSTLRIHARDGAGNVSETLSGALVIRLPTTD
jgi:hypothetical protein